MNNYVINASITNFYQLQPLLELGIYKVYVPFDHFYWGITDESYIDFVHKKYNTLIYLSLPRIIRDRDDIYIDTLKKFLLLGKVDGLLVRNLEELGFIMSLKDDLEKEYISINGEIEGYTSLFLDFDSSLYAWNKQALTFNKKFCNVQTAALELSIHELKELDDRDLIISVYGRALLMVSANCVKKSTGNCSADCTHQSFSYGLIDRTGKKEPVFCNCIHCYNEIYNAVPTSYHKQIRNLINEHFHSFRLDFTDESVTSVKNITQYYMNGIFSRDFPVKEYTTGHILKGAL